jgi:replicative DNA helicase
MVWRIYGAFMTLPSTPVPHNREAEEAVIGSVLINQEVFYEIDQFLRAEDFYIVRNRWIWAAFTKLSKKKMPIDLLTVSKELEDAGQLTELGGSAYLTEMLGQSPSSLHAVAYAKMVWGDSIRRGMITAANYIATCAYKTTVPIEEAIANSAGEMQKIVSKAFSTNGTIKTVSQLAAEHYQTAAEMVKHPEAVKGIMTGLIDLDKKFGVGLGLQKKFVLLAGRPGVGKTSLALQIALTAALANHRVCIFSLDMDDSAQLANILLSILTGIDNQRLAIGKITDEEKVIYKIALDKFAKLPLIIDDTLPMTIQSIRAKSLSLKSSGGLDLVVIDYLMLIEGYGNKEENDKANLLTRELKLLKKELDCPLIVIHHMNRAIEKRGDGEPMLSDLNEGGEKDPDIVMFVYEPKETSFGDITPRKVSFGKHRGGEKGKVNLLFRGSCTTFLNQAKEQR